MYVLFRYALLGVVLVFSSISVVDVMAQSLLPVVPKPCNVKTIGSERFCFSDTTKVFVDKSFDSDEIKCILAIYKNLNRLFFLRFKLYNL